MLCVRTRGRRLLVPIAVIAVLSLVLLNGTDAFARSSSSAHGSRSSHHMTYYVSLGDSYAVGYQPAPRPGATRGYTGIVSKATHTRLVNFGCGGATTSSILRVTGCTSPYGPAASDGAVSYPHETQAQAAVAFIDRHRASIGLVTVSIGGNDITHCASSSEPVTCVTAAIPSVEHNVATLAEELRKAAGPNVPIIGLTYPDVLLGLWVYPASSPDTTLATLSVTGFRSLFNPALTKAYAAAGGHLVDITKEADGYVPLSRTTKLAPYGRIPVAVAHVCRLTWYCQEGNIHANTAGYDFIGKQVVAAYRALRR